MTLEEKIRQGFNRAKITYDQHCQLQMQIGKKLIETICDGEIISPHILDLGCGTGLVTHILANAQPHRQLTGLDVADELLKLAKGRFANKGTFVCADFNKIPIDNEQLDLVFSNMTLQWSSNIGGTLREITRVIRPGGYLAFTLPVEGTFARIKQWLFRLTGQWHLNEFMLITHIMEQLKNGGFKTMVNNLDDYHLFFPDLTSAFRSMKKVGALISQQPYKPLTKSVYQETFNENITLDYKILTIIAKKI